MALNDYKIIKELGSGGFGKTYLVQALKLPGNPQRVLKRFSPSQTPTPDILRVLERLFEKEATMLGKLGNHPQIPSLYEFFQDGEQFSFIQEYVEGKNLKSEEIKDGIKLSEQKVLSLLEEILEVLEFIHQNDAIHLDLKPENIMRRKLDGKIVLIDFGGAKQTSALEVRPDGNTVMTVTVGTPGYMPSEQSNGTPRPASDVYAVGKIAIQALTGTHPYRIPEDVNTGEVLWRGLASGVSPDFSKVLDKMILYHFKDRYKNATEALKAVRELKAKVEPVAFPRIRANPNNNQVRRQVQNLGIPNYLYNDKWFIIAMFGVFVSYGISAAFVNGLRMPIFHLVTWLTSGAIATPLLLRFANLRENRPIRVFASCVILATLIGSLVWTVSIYDNTNFANFITRIPFTSFVLIGFSILFSHLHLCSELQAQGKSMANKEAIGLAFFNLLWIYMGAYLGYSIRLYVFKLW